MDIHQGHILTAHCKDTPNGIEITYYGVSQANAFKLSFPQQKFVFFIPSDAHFSPQNISFERKKSKLLSFDKKSVDIIYLKFLKDIQTIKDYCEQNSLRTYEIDIPLEERFLMERFIYAQVEFTGKFTNENNLLTFTSPQIRPCLTSQNFSQLSLDIETGVDGRLYSIGLYFKDSLKKTTNKVLMLAQEEKIIDYVEYLESERKLIMRFIEILKDFDPDILIGWHVIGFDLMFLEKKFKEYSIPFSLGRDNKEVSLYERKGSGFYADIPGRIVIDGPPTLRSAFYRFKNFKLETVATEILGIGKDISSDENKVAEIERRFKEDKQSLAKYNLLDCKLVMDIYDKINLIDFVMARTKISGLLFNRLNISTAAFDHIMLPQLHRKGFVAPNRIDIIRDQSSGGGMVIEPTPGVYTDIAVFDFKSLYPSIIKSFSIDPYSRLQSDIDPVKTPAGHQFSKSQTILPAVIKKLMQYRHQAKLENNSPLSQAIKILMNSFYGVMGSSRCRFYHAELPEAITTTGHWILIRTKEYFENHNQKVIYGDTDSLFVQMQDPSEKGCHAIAQEINIYLRKLLYEEFGVQSFLECEFESLYQKIFFSKSRSSEAGAKKRYVGYKDYKLDFKGMEFVRSDWTELAKKFQYEIFEKFFTNEDIESYIKTYIKELENGLYDNLLTYTKRLSKSPEEYTKNIPIHVKAALKLQHKGPYRLKQIQYAITQNGPEPVQKITADYDYSHYIEKQIRPIAEDILQAQGKSFDALRLGDQLSFF
jgi:DNA polymerase-2